MNVLLLVSKGEPPKELIADMQREGHLVNSVTTPKAALDLMTRDPPDITLVSDELVGDNFPAILQKTLNADDIYRSLVVVTGKDSADRRTALFAAGVDDVAGPNVSPRELASRIKSVERIVRLERRLRERVRELESALSRLEMQAVRRGVAIAAATKGGPPAQGTPFLLTPAWTGVEEILGKMCLEYLQVPFQLVAGVALPGSGSPGATVSLTDVEHELKIDLTFFAPASSARAIAAAFCGDPSIVDDEIIRDVLLELTNSGMGAVKSAFLNDGYKFAGATPKAKVFASIDQLIKDAEAKRALTYRSESSFVHAVVAVRRTPRVRIKASSLREGMVVAVDVVNEAGVLIIPAGTRLTETSADRIRRMVPKAEVELADPNQG